MTTTNILMYFMFIVERLINSVQLINQKYLNGIGVKLPEPEAAAPAAPETSNTEVVK